MDSKIRRKQERKHLNWRCPPPPSKVVVSRQHQDGSAELQKMISAYGLPLRIDKIVREEVACRSRVFWRVKGGRKPFGTVIDDLEFYAVAPGNRERLMMERIREDYEDRKVGPPDPFTWRMGQEVKLEGGTLWRVIATDRDSRDREKVTLRRSKSNEVITVSLAELEARRPKPTFGLFDENDDDFAERRRRAKQ